MKSISVKHLFFYIVLFFFLSCSNNKDEGNDIQNIEEQSFPCTIECNNTISDSVNLLPVGVANQLFKHIKKFEGTQFNILTKMPDTWGIECKLPSFSPNFELWIVSNTGESFIKLLAIVTAAENPTIIQALPIAYNVAVEEANYIESEYWSADIDNTYNVIVAKKYERLYSITEQNIENKSISTTKKDSYKIELDGKISYQKPETFDADYNAIIQFADTSVIGSLNEDWVLNSMEVQEKIESLNILFITVTSYFDKVEIKNYYGETVDIVDISNFINKHNMGYLALKKGEKTLFIPYSTAERCLQKAEEYFKVDIIEKNTVNENE